MSVRSVCIYRPRRVGNRKISFFTESKMSSLTPLLSGNIFNNHRQNLQVTNTVIMWYHIYSVRRSMFIITEQFLSGIYSFETRLFPFLANRMFLTNWNKMVRSYSINRLEVKVFRSLRLKNFLPLWLKVRMRIRIHFHGPRLFKNYMHHCTVLEV